jgi:hypothetical protein
MTDSVRKVVNAFFALDERDQQAAMSLVLHKYWQGTPEQQPDVPVSRGEVDALVSALTRDVLATVGPGYEDLISSTAEDHLRFGNPHGNYTSRVVADLQQQFHDQFIDTSWPECPMHGRHPLGFSAGFWSCYQPVVKIKLGELAQR